MLYYILPSIAHTGVSFLVLVLENEKTKEVNIFLWEQVGWKIEA